MQKTKIKPAQIEKLLSNHGLQKYDLCKICDVSGITAERWLKYGMPEAQFKLVKLSLGDM